MATVLIVDDGRVTRDRLRQLLNAHGHEVIEAADGKEAIATLHRTPGIDVIALDLVMPGVSGWEFRELQLQEPAFAGIPTIIITVQPLGEHARYALRVGKATVVQKPFEDADVMDALSRILGTAPGPG